jgi:hypothetical protein
MLQWVLGLIGRNVASNMEGVKMAEAQGEHMTVAQAQAFLGVSKKKIAALLASAEGADEPGKLTWVRDPMDGRLKWIRRADVEALRDRSIKKGADAA